MKFILYCAGYVCIFYLRKEVLFKFEVLGKPVLILKLRKILNEPLYTVSQLCAKVAKTNSICVKFYYNAN